MLRSFPLKNILDLCLLSHHKRQQWLGLSYSGQNWCRWEAQAPSREGVLLSYVTAVHGRHHLFECHTKGLGSCGKCGAKIQIEGRNCQVMWSAGDHLHPSSFLESSLRFRCALKQMAVYVVTPTL